MRARLWQRSGAYLEPRHPRYALSPRHSGHGGARHHLSLVRPERHGASHRRRAGWSNIRRPPGARATSARGRSNCCCRSAITNRCETSCASSSPSNGKETGDWPQWFMLDPYRQIRDRHSHGDVIVWPLKALCDYLEAHRRFRLPGRAARLDAGRFRADRPARPGPASMSRRCWRQSASGSSPARISSAMASATGTTRSSPPIRRCATGWSAAGRSRCSISRSSRYARMLRASR